MYNATGVLVKEYTLVLPSLLRNYFENQDVFIGRNWMTVNNDGTLLYLLVQVPIGNIVFTCSVEKPQEECLFAHIYDRPLLPPYNPNRDTFVSYSGLAYINSSNSVATIISFDLGSNLPPQILVYDI